MLQQAKTEQVKQAFPLITEYVERALQQGSLINEGIRTNTKSGIISDLVAKAAGIYIDNASTPIVDSQPDILLDAESLEVKVTVSTTDWTGNKKSNRKDDFLLISYKQTEEGMKWFALYTVLKKEDFIPNPSKRMASTRITLNYILDNREYEIIRGDYRFATSLHHTVHV